MARRRKRRDKPRKALYQLEHNRLYQQTRQYLRWCAAMNYSPHTIKNRNYALTRFVAWCDERGIEEMNNITYTILERYRSHLHGNISFVTQAGYIQAIRCFFKWAVQSHLLDSNPASELQLPKLGQRLPRSILSEEDVKRLIQCASDNPSIGLRDRAIIALLYSTGIRRMECQNLKLSDIDVSDRILLVRSGKGKKDRYIPVGQQATTWIEHYVEQLRELLMMPPDEGYLFISDLGEAFHNNQLSDLVKRYLIKAGIECRGACHLLRHAMATHMLNNGADIRYIQMMLGHSDLSTTQIYTQVSIQKLKAVHAATHPGG